MKRFLPALGASAVVGLVLATRPLDGVPRTVAISAAVLSWLAALLVARPILRKHASVVLAIAAVTAAGEVAGGLVYAIPCGLFLAVTLYAMRGDVPFVRPPWRALLVLGGGAVGVAGGLLVALPRLAVLVENRVNAMLGTTFEEATAFSTTMVLGATRGMLQSDAIVLRIDGKRPAYLRGAVYDRYGGRTWTTTAVGREATPRPTSTAQPTTRITLAAGAPMGEDMRWFLPPNACELSPNEPSVAVDGFGVARRSIGTTIGMRDDCVPLPVAPPTPTDTELSPVMHRWFAPIAAKFVGSARTDREKLDAIEHELSGFEYSLAVERSQIDPIMDFLTVHRAGHCEYFASAMVLLARSQGIPARVVGGYRVTEVNRFTGRAIVRDRNAHTWVEAWVDGAWRTWDPTPTSESFAPRESLFESLGEVARVAFERLSLRTAGLVLGGAALVLAIVRRLRMRGPRRVRAAASLPAFEALRAALERAGHVRDPGEPLEAFAVRLRGAGAPDAATAVEAYAAFRYGGLGGEGDVADRLTAATRRQR